MKKEMQGRGSARVRDLYLYGETTGQTDDYGVPVCCNWDAPHWDKSIAAYC
jgi:hypothetical protein